MKNLPTDFPLIARDLTVTLTVTVTGKPYQILLSLLLLLLVLLPPLCITSSLISHSGALGYFLGPYCFVLFCTYSFSVSACKPCS